jgi:hypothetical protein
MTVTPSGTAKVGWRHLPKNIDRVSVVREVGSGRRETGAAVNRFGPRLAGFSKRVELVLRWAWWLRIIMAMAG